MVKRTTTLEWQVELEDTTWNRPQSLVEPVEASYDGDVAATAQLSWWHRPVLPAAIGLVMLTLSVAGLVLWRQAQAGYQQVQLDIAETLELETWSAQTGNRMVADSLVDTGTPPAWRDRIALEGPIFRGQASDQQITIEAVDLMEDLAMVQVRLARVGPQGFSDPYGSYRATRYYRLVDEQWLRTAPDPRLWGASQTMETAYFQFHFHTKDGDAVRQAAARLDAIYANLRRDLGLAQPHADAQKRRVEVLAQIPRRNLYFSMDVDQLRVLSPLMLTVPDNVSDAEILTKAITHQLVRNTVYEALPAQDVHRTWAILVEGIQLWQAYEGSNSLPLWYENTVTWLHRDVPAIRAGDRVPSVNDLNLLCRGYDIWDVTVPLDLSVSSLCRAEDWSSYLRSVPPASSKLSGLLYYAECYECTKPWFGNWMQGITAATVVEYLAETYGREQLPVLIEAMRLYGSWEELIPEVVGVTAEEFEAGWQTYVATRYGGCESECAVGILWTE